MRQGFTKNTDMINQEKIAAVLREAGLSRWLQQSDLGRYAVAAEQRFIQTAMPDHGQQTVAASLSACYTWPAGTLRLGCQPQAADIVSALPALPLADASAGLLLLPHGLELVSGCSQNQLLREAFRVLQPYGRLVLTGFNPHSLWRGSRLWQDLDLQEQMLPLAEVKKRLQDHGFRVAEGRFMVYVPPLRHRRSLACWRFMEAAGNRWWPHAAAIYGLVVQKTVCPLTPISAEAHGCLPEGEWILAPASGQTVAPRP